MPKKLTELERLNKERKRLVKLRSWSMNWQYWTPRIKELENKIKSIETCQSTDAGE